MKSPLAFVSASVALLMQGAVCRTASEGRMSAARLRLAAKALFLA
jgi:hypothetical protein